MNPHSRHKARFCAIQAIYQWQLANPELPQLLTQFLQDPRPEFKKMDKDYFTKLVSNIVAQTETLDNILTPHLDRGINEVSQVELAILRVGAGELQFCLDVPYRVVINEALELAKTFGGKNSHKYINGVLDHVARATRPTEFGAIGEQDA